MQTTELSQTAEVVVVGGGIAGLAAAIYLARAERDVLVVDSGKSMACWEPEVENYPGFPEGIAGTELLQRMREQAARYGARFASDEINGTGRKRGMFVLRGNAGRYVGARVLLATGIFHLPPQIEGVRECLGHSMFFCKDCDGYRVRGKRVAVYGWTDEAVETALALSFYSGSLAIVTDGREPHWDRQHAAWIEEYGVPVHRAPIVAIGREGCDLRSLKWPKGGELEIDALFTMRGDVYLNKLARSLGASVDDEGQVVVDLRMHTTVKGLYAAGCVTPANCQMIIAAGQGATAAQAINRDLFDESLETHSLRRFRSEQLRRLNQTGASHDRKTIHRRRRIRPLRSLVGRR